MHHLKAALPLALAACAIAASPAAAMTGDGPTAKASGGDAGPPTYPGLVNSRLVRTQKALDNAVGYADDGDTAHAVNSLYNARLQVKLAWRAAKYVIQHAPPPPAGDGLAARMSGGAPPGGTIADQFKTAGAVLDLQHSVTQTAIGMIDTAHGTLRDSLSRTMFLALDQRDAAIAYIHSIDVPPPAGGDGIAAHKSGGAVAGSWGTIMPAVGTVVGDEIDQIEGALDLSTTLGKGVRGVLKDAELQTVKTQRTITTYWPPVVGDG
jgi:hypothetical protein